MLRRKGRKMEVLVSKCLKSRTNQYLRRYSPTKFLLIYKSLIRIGCLTLSFKRVKVVVHKVRNGIVPNVVRRMRVNVLVV